MLSRSSCVDDETPASKRFGANTDNLDVMALESFVQTRQHRNAKAIGAQRSEHYVRTDRTPTDEAGGRYEVPLEPLPFSWNSLSW